MANFQVVKPNWNSGVTFRPNVRKVGKSTWNVLETYQRGLVAQEMSLLDQAKHDRTIY